MKRSVITKFRFFLKLTCRTSTCTSYLDKDLFIACFVYLILSQKILDLTENIKNLTFLKIQFDSKRWAQLNQETAPQHTPDSWLWYSKFSARSTGLTCVGYAQNSLQFDSRSPLIHAKFLVLHSSHFVLNRRCCIAVYQASALAVVLEN